MASLVPGLDTVADLAAIPVDLMRGDYMSALFDLVGVIPGIGEAGDTAKLARMGIKAGETAGDVVKNMVNTSELIGTHSLTKSKKQLQELLDDIKINGIQEPIKFVEYNGKKYVVDGHHRLRAARRLGLENVPIEKVELPYKGYSAVEDLFWGE